MASSFRRSSLVPVIGALALGFALVPIRSQTAAEVQNTPSTPYEAALQHYHTGKYQDARAEIDTAEKANPGDLAIETLKARILTEQGDFTGGEKILRSLLTPSGPLEVQMTLGDLFLRKRDFTAAAKQYDICLQAKPGDPDLMLKMVYAHIGSNDLPEAEKIASKLKPLDPTHPSYYFARAALAQTTGDSTTADQDIENAHTIYGVIIVNRYLKTYLEVLANPKKSPAAPGATNAAPSGAASQP